MAALIIDTATPVCAVGLFNPAQSGAAVLEVCLDRVVGRGHAEQLMPMIAALPDGGRVERLLINVGPGSFTGIRVGLAAAQGLALGWQAELMGYSTLALLAWQARSGANAPGRIWAAMPGGHGEVFVQAFQGKGGTMVEDGALLSLSPQAASEVLAGAPCAWLKDRQIPPEFETCALYEVGLDIGAVPSLPSGLQSLPARPLYGRAPDARPATRPVSKFATGPLRPEMRVREAGIDDLDAIMNVMETAFDARFGEAWSRVQCQDFFGFSGVTFLLLEKERPLGFAVTRTVVDEMELMLVGVARSEQGQGLGKLLMDTIIDRARRNSCRKVFLEARMGNPATRLYRSAGFVPIGRRPDYYRGTGGLIFDAETFQFEFK